MGKHAAPGTTRTWGQRAVLAFNVVACVGCLLAAGALTWTWQRVREIPRVELTGLLQPVDSAIAEGQVQNVLIVGTDSADGLPDDDPRRLGRGAGIRSDT
ncbi:MAG TPA: hypothetical protein VHI95_01175, partial [Acidimicrobiales bacterium]|nr:hypothetical protein [Acidimicrobiales bacterium]